MRLPDRRRFVPWLLAAIVLFTTWAVVLFVTGGFHLPLGPFSISSRKPERPGIIALLLMAVFVWLLGRDGRRDAAAHVLRQWRMLVSIVTGFSSFVPRARTCAAALAIAVGALGWAYGSQTAGGSDAFAYLSQAALIRTGRLDVPVPLATRAPWPEAAESFAPLGYRARPDGRSIVPITAPGVPLVMAGLQIVGGHRAAFLVTPLAGALLVWLTFLLGRHVRSAGAGLAAAWLVATSPAFLFNLMWPMTDIAAALWACLMVWLVLRDSARSSLFAGLAASMGLLTRTNFVLLAAGVIGWLAASALAERRRSDFVRIVAFVAGLFPGAGLAAWFNMRWFGRALASGYGSPSQLLSLDSVAVNAEHYARWLLETSPILASGVVMMCVPLSLFWGRPGWRVPLLFLLTTLATISVYLVYQPFNDWWYLRFLLPFWPLAAVGVSVIVAVSWTRSHLFGAVLATVVVVSGWYGFDLARARGVFLLGEERYATVAALVASATEPAAIVLTISHSGSVRYYAGRETVRFNAIEPAWLDRTIEWLAARGRKPYILVEDWELPYFRERFQSASAVGGLNFPPAVTWESVNVAGRVYLYDPIDQGRFATADPGAALDRAQPRSSPSRFPKLAFE